MQAVGLMGMQGEITKDAVYADAERRFQELETETKKLHDESQKYATQGFCEGLH